MFTLCLDAHHIHLKMLNIKKLTVYYYLFKKIIFKFFIKILHGKISIAREYNQHPIIINLQAN